MKLKDNKTNFKVNKDFKDIAILNNGHFTTLESCFKSFCHTYENNKMLAPDKHSQIFRWEEDKEDKVIELNFTYSFLNEEGETIKINLKTSLPVVFGLLWDIQQAFLIMQKMYIIKLNNQIINL
jgi:hypothetical protein